MTKKEKTLREKIETYILMALNMAGVEEKEAIEHAEIASGMILELFSQQKRETKESFKRVVEKANCHFVNGKGVLINRSDILKAIEEL